MSSQISYGEVIATYNSNYTRVLRYSLEISHSGLHDHKIISAPDTSMLQNKVQAQIDKWEDQWNLIQSKQRKLEHQQNLQEKAETQTKDAIQKIEEFKSILKQTISINDVVDWDSLKNNKIFQKPDPMNSLELEVAKLKKPVKYNELAVPDPPNQNSIKYIARPSLLDKIFPFIKRRNIEIGKKLFELDFQAWKKQKEKIEEENKINTLRYEEDGTRFEKLKNELLEKLKEQNQLWKSEKEKFESEKIQYNEKIEELKNRYEQMDQDAVIEYNEIVLNRSDYPDELSKSFELSFNKESSLLIVEYELPDITKMPTNKEYRYLQAKNSIKEVPLTEKEVLELYDTVIYQIILRTIHEIFEADYIDCIKQIVMNGWVHSLNKSTGKTDYLCIASISVSKSEFLSINLVNVDPKSCFKSLKGVGSSKISSLTPIKPLLQINKADSRIVEGYDVASEIDDSFNLATMDWEDFEHLIRQLFEQEFKSSGGEVKVTQASRDGGVDAIAFDPDPIRGGKIVIQAKRYNNTVGVSAVRDLFGTVMNEGANKGILVTTSDYGPDAYNFVKDKPITLLNGANLLFLLEKHGTKARINLKEVKSRNIY